MKKDSTRAPKNGQAWKLTVAIIVAIVIVVMWTVWWYFETRIAMIK